VFHPDPGLVGEQDHGRLAAGSQAASPRRARWTGLRRSGGSRRLERWSGAPDGADRLGLVTEHDHDLVDARDGGGVDDVLDDRPAPIRASCFVRPNRVEEPAASTTAEITASATVGSMARSTIGPHPSSMTSSRRGYRGRCRRPGTRIGFGPMGGFDGRVALVTGREPTGIGFAAGRALGREERPSRSRRPPSGRRARAELAREGVEALGSSPISPTGTPRTSSCRGPRALRPHRRPREQRGHDPDGLPGGSRRRCGRGPHEARFERDLALNLKTAFHVSRAVLPGMIERGYGRIVMVSSVTGPSRRTRRTPATRRGRRHGRSHADDRPGGRRSGVTCNSVLPGWIATGSQLDEEDVAGRNTPIAAAARRTRSRR